MLKPVATFTLCLALSIPALAQQSAGARDSAIWRSADSLAKQPHGQIRLGSPTPNAILYINGEERGPISTASYRNVPADKPFTVSIRAKQCTQAWDTTMTVANGAAIVIGRRLTTCKH